MSRVARSLEPCALVIFGASGDLTRRKLLPALYMLHVQGQLPAGLCIVGVGRREANFVEDMRQAVEAFARVQPISSEHWQSFSERLFYVQGEFSDAALYQKLATVLQQLDATHGTKQNRLFYLSTPPELFPVLLAQLSENNLLSEQTRPFCRVVIEKPFGRDLVSAQTLNALCERVLREDQIFRIDHYLGKETVQNILALRFANSLFEPIWNRSYIDHVQITVAESIGIENRGGYYDASGALRDMIQNHLFQVLSLVAMEPPLSLTAEAVRNEKVKVLQGLREPSLPDTQEWLVRGQYTAGFLHGKPVPGYKQELDVPKESATETYVALKVWIDNWRWGGVPFYIRSGKRLPRRVSEIAIVFKDTPHRLFYEQRGGQPQAATPVEKHANVLVLRLQPDEGTSLTVLSKTPGPALHVEPVVLDFRFGAQFDGPPPDAYERLLLDALTGDGTLFIRRDEVVASWRFCDRILQAWKQTPAEHPVHGYSAGSWGPPEAEWLLAREGRRWREP